MRNSKIIIIIIIITVIIITITDKQNKYQELANEICAMWKQKAPQVDPDSNVIYGNNSKVIITKSNNT